MVIEIGSNVRKLKKIYAGQGHKPLVIASIGKSNANDDSFLEIQKAKAAEDYGASIIIDHTLTKDSIDFQKRIIEETNIPLSAIAVYEAYTLNNDHYYDSDYALKIIENMAIRGIDLITIHASVFKEDIKFLNESKRIIPCTSRGGTMVMQNMIKTQKENFYWDHFDDILEIANKYQITLSLGSIFRPASIKDCVNNNDMYWEELKRNSLLVQKTIKKNISIMVEGIGHAPIDLIPNIVIESKKICYNVPYRVLGVATDSALGFDHIASAIASSTAVAAGADLVTAVSRSEHLGLPSKEDLIEAVVSAKIAAHCGYIARNKNYSLDNAMAYARKDNGCKGCIDASISPLTTINALKIHNGQLGKKCKMCGDYCALYSLDELKKKI
jgi:phosphomethylpyrimidine synthase